MQDPRTNEKEAKEESQKLANELAVYLWENYVECVSSPSAPQTSS